MSIRSAQIKKKSYKLFLDTGGQKNPKHTLNWSIRAKINKSRALHLVHYLYLWQPFMYKVLCPSLRPGGRGWEGGYGEARGMTAYLCDIFSLNPQPIYNWPLPPPNILWKSVLSQILYIINRGQPLGWGVTALFFTKFDMYIINRGLLTEPPPQLIIYRTWGQYWFPECILGRGGGSIIYWLGALGTS